MVLAAGASDNVVSGLGNQFDLHKYASVALRALRRHQSFSQRVEHGAPSDCSTRRLLCFHKYLTLFCFAHFGNKAFAVIRLVGNSHTNWFGVCIRFRSSCGFCDPRLRHFLTNAGGYLGVEISFLRFLM